MVRVARIKSGRTGAIYHVMTRTARQAFLFDDDQSKEWIYKKMLWLGSIFHIDFHAISVMSNHYHLVLSVLKPEFDESDVQARFLAYQKRKRHPQRWYPFRAEEWHRRFSDLSCFMQEVNRSIALYLNRRDGVRGHVWGDRFKSVLIEDGVGLLQCMAYVELNPVRAGLCERPSQYRFCSVGRFHGGGSRAAGVVVPALSGFHFLPDRNKRQAAFGLFVDHLAGLHVGQRCYPCDHETIELLVADVDIPSMVDLAFRRSRWAVNSLFLGSKSFCAEMMTQHGLKPWWQEHPEPFGLAPGLFNGHQRAGPHCT